jgi:hypothetical protein
MIAMVAALLLFWIPAECADKKPVVFRVVSMGEIEDTEATKAGFHTRWWPDAHFGFTSFRASNGKGLLVIYDDFQKPDEAKRFFDWKVGRSFKVLSQTTKADPKGNTVEYRAESVPASDHSSIEVMWVVGVSVHVISAQNLADALELERQYGH